MSLTLKNDEYIGDIPAVYQDLTMNERRLVREAYIRKQGGICSHCQRPLTDLPHPDVAELVVDDSLFPKQFFKYPVHLHHDHKTGLTIGAVHNYCNAVLWQYFGE